MSKLQRVMLIIKSLLMFAVGLILLVTPDETGYFVVAIIMGVAITLLGIKNVFFYITSARHMVGGGKILINGVVLLDFGIISFFVLLRSATIAMLYLVSMFILLGVIDLLRSFEIKRNGSKAWIIKLIKGIVTISIGVICIVFIKSTGLAVLLFAIGWIVSGVEGIISAFSKSGVLHIA